MSLSFHHGDPGVTLRVVSPPETRHLRPPGQLLLAIVGCNQEFLIEGNSRSSKKTHFKVTEQGKNVLIVCLQEDKRFG